MNYSPSYSTVIFTAKEQPEFAFSSNKNQLNTNFLYSPLKHCSEWIHISFFSSTETRNLALGVTLSHCWQRRTAGWHLSSATAELKYSVPSSKLHTKQTNKQKAFQEFSKSSLKQKWICENSIYFSAIHLHQKNLHQVSHELCTELCTD